MEHNMILAHLYCVAFGKSDLNGYFHEFLPMNTNKPHFQVITRKTVGLFSLRFGQQCLPAREPRDSVKFIYQKKKSTKFTVCDMLLKIITTNYTSEPPKSFKWLHIHELMGLFSWHC